MILNVVTPIALFTPSDSCSAISTSLPPFFSLNTLSPTQLRTFLFHPQKSRILIVPFPPFCIIRTDELKSTNTGSTPDTTASQVGHVFPLQSFKQLRDLNSPSFSFFQVLPLNNRYAFCSQPRRAHNQTRLTRRLSSAGVGFV
ncbi:hypothetical protein BLNAU_24822 [Blattamonas nauphoetae]|uniref:Uncharacterized protein n=1 Tax=Blattamonas nauphoetae TaxID=2049346 RepID=A0ABQ9WNF9_9EUKA|nr:hypothetical protein BLNAU_24822 [Blattamonas nauphoetae]